MFIGLKLDEDQPLLTLTEERLEGYDAIIVKLGEEEAIVSIDELEEAVESFARLLALRQRKNDELVTGARVTSG